MVTGTHPFTAWRARSKDAALPEGIEIVTGRSGAPTLKVRGVLMHSQYNPREEAARFVDSLQLELDKPVAVVGLGLGYHVLELTRRGHTVAVFEPDIGVAIAACQVVTGETDFDLTVGSPDFKSDVLAGKEWRNSQWIVHPATARLHPNYVSECQNAVAAASLSGQRLNIAVVGPMYGGSLPIAEFLARAFARLGHRVKYIENSEAWPLYQTIDHSLHGSKPAGQLNAMLVNLVSEWTYARVIEFRADICIALAQAPLKPDFPKRLRDAGIVSAFWYVENWRHLPYWGDICAHYDAFFHIQPGTFETRLHNAGCPLQAVVLTGCDPEIHAPIQIDPAENAEYSCDISFAGAGYPNRNRLLSGLTDQKLKIWGVNWTAREILPFVQHPEQRFTPSMFAKIVAGSKINLNLHSSTASEGVDAECDAINPRVFEIAACGGFQLCDPCKGLDGCFDTELEIPTYSSLPDLREKIAYFLNHPKEREDMAKRARKRALQDHSYDRRAQQMLDILLPRYASRMLAKGILKQCTIEEILRRIENNSPLAEFLATLPPQTPFTQEAINEHLTTSGITPDHAQALFLYLKDMRDAAESLLAEFENA
ncbi:MAG: hypothetical protein AMXMBFR84_45990 [Candidatus Hydrogenedentota bacterium]